MKIELIVPNSLDISNETLQIFKLFAQNGLNRICVGELRYGKANKKKKYMTRMKKEMEVYEKTGNAEHLLNIFNYCPLEWIAPEHSKHHFNPTVESVTRNGNPKTD